MERLAVDVEHLEESPFGSLAADRVGANNLSGNADKISQGYAGIGIGAFAEGSLHVAFEVLHLLRIHFELVAALDGFDEFPHLVFFALRAGHEVCRLEGLRTAFGVAIHIGDDGADDRGRIEALLLLFEIVLQQQLKLTRRAAQELVAGESVTVTGTGPELDDIWSFSAGAGSPGAVAFGFGFAFGIQAASASNILSAMLRVSAQIPSFSPRSSKLKGARQLPSG